MKVIFMDHDGVICLESQWGTRFEKEGTLKREGTIWDVPILNRFDDFDKNCVQCLNEIIRETDCEIVISSDWRTWATLEELGEYYTHHGIIKKPIGFTPFIDRNEVPEEYNFRPGFGHNQIRVLEIKKWLQEHPEVENWVAIDDMQMGDEVWGLQNFVLSSDYLLGLCNDQVRTLLLEYLNQTEVVR